MHLDINFFSSNFSRFENFLYFNKIWLNNFKFSKFIQIGLGMAGPSYKAEPEISPYLKGIYNRIDICDLRWSYFVYRQTFLFLNNFLKANSSSTLIPPIIHIATREDLRPQNRIMANYLGHLHVSTQWKGGILTNTAQRDLRIFISNAQSHNLKGKEMPWHIKAVFRRKIDLPSLVLVWETNFDDYAIDDSLNLKIPTLAVVDNIVDPKRIIYPLIGQNVTKEIIALYQNLFKKFF